MKSLSFGIIHGETVRESLSDILVIAPKNWVAVIRSVDSERSPSKVHSILERYGITGREEAGNIVLRANVLWHAVAGELFQGFDEVWFFCDQAPSIALQGFPPITSDAFDFSVSIPTELTEAFENLNCKLMLGDGCGLNFVTNDDNVGKLLLGLNI